MTAQKIVASYFVMQSLATAAWWALLIYVPASIEWFQPTSFPDQALLGFGLADGIMLIAGSLLVAIGVARETAWARTAVWALVAVAWYPTLYCLGVSWLTGQAWLASALMVSLAGLSWAMATIYGTAGQQSATIRVTPLQPLPAIAWTLFQILIFWSVFLWVLPHGIIELENRLGGTRFTHSLQSTASMILFGWASALGLWSGITMATRGSGTPLPTATAPQLVIAGPYCFVRNPMAVAGIVQGLAVGWYFGSISVLIYALTGAIAWHVFVRPLEEADLQQRFGAAYTDYQMKVGLWLPRF